jgi:hypothetical protein
VCEGATEENFVTRVLYPHFILKNILVTPRNIGTGSSYGKLKFNVIQWLKQEAGAYVTTLLDIYGMGNKYPGYEANKGFEAYEKAIGIEKAFQDDIEATGISVYRFIPHFQLHEFEAILFSDCAVLEDFLALDYTFEPGSLQNIRNQFTSPEHINDSPLTAPSKRILSIIPTYEKVADGILVAEAISLETIRAQCNHFDAWITKLENLSDV